MQSKPRQLNKGQLEVLDLIFKFRFATSELIAQIQNKQNGTPIRSRLNILLKHNLIARHYKGTDKLQGKYASYYLLPDGLRELEAHQIRTDLPDPVIKSIYKYKSMSPQFINHCLHIFEVCTKLKNIYGDNVKTFTRPELASFGYFPRPLPDVFIALKKDDKTTRFFLEVVEPNTPSFALNRRLKQYAEYYESGAWEATNSDFPTILFVCASEGLERKLQKRIGTVSEELEVYTTILSSLNVTTNDKVWSSESEEPKKSLQEL